MKKRRHSGRIIWYTCTYLDFRVDQVIYALQKASDYIDWNQGGFYSIELGVKL